MTEPQAPLPVAGRGSPLSVAVTLIVFIGLILYFFNLPLRPTAWGGPRGKGPFEEGVLPGVGWFARDARIYLSSVSEYRSPGRRLDATAEALVGYYALIALARFVVFWLILRRLGGSPMLATVGVVAAALPLVIGTPRQTESEVGLFLFVVLLAATTPSRVSWWAATVGVPLLFAVWANAHTSVVIGLAWLTVITAGRAVEWWRARWRGEDESPAWTRLVVAIVLGAAVACLNPDGPAIFVDAFKVTKNPNTVSLSDWQPVDFSKSAGMPWAYFATLAGLLVAQLVSPRVFSSTALLVLLTFGLWPLIQQRGLGYWWLIVPWLVLQQLAPFVRCTNAGRGPPRWGRWTVLIALAILLFMMPAGRWLVSGRPRLIGEIVAANTPWRVGRELTAEGSDVGNFVPQLRETVQASYPSRKYRGAILCDVEQGDFLAWVLDGDNTQPVMLYTRPETLDPPHWAEAHRALEGQGDWWEILGRHQVNLVVIDPGKWGKLAERLRGSPSWRTVQDDVLLVAVRREPKLPAEMQDQ